MTTGVARRGGGLGYQWPSYVLELPDGIWYLLSNVEVRAAGRHILCVSCSICGLP